MRDHQSIQKEVAAIFSDKLHVEVPSYDLDLFEGGILDSLQLVELLFQLEQQFRVCISLDSLDLDDFRSIDRITGCSHVKTETEVQLNLRLCASISFSSTHPILMFPFEETLGAMAAMVDVGKVRFIGVNNFSVAQLQEAQTRYPIVSNASALQRN